MSRRSKPADISDTGSRVRRWPWPLLCVLMLGCAGRNGPDGDEAPSVLPEQVTSTEVEVGQGVVGTLVLPRGRGPHPAVLMLHGFGSDRDEVDELFARTAMELAAEEIASLRIDFRGSGESAGMFEDTTVSRQVADATNALTWLREHDAIDPARVGLLGFSLGGAVAILTAGERSFEVTSVVVWSTVGDLEADFLVILGEETFDKARRDGRVTHDLGWRKVTLKREFFDDLGEHRVDDALRQYNGPFLAIAGTDDPLARYSRPLAELVDGMTVMVRDANHTFRSSSEIDTQAETVIQTTIVRFNGTLRWQ